jgi:sugar lactone lactonase YvrE
MGEGNNGGLFRVDRDGTVSNLFKRTNCSNGMAFTADLQHFYWTDSSGRTIYKFAYDRDSGQLSDRKTVVEVQEGEGVPDGMALDAEGNIWSARWDGFGLFQYSPSGELMGKIDFPVAKVSSILFGGEAYEDMYITTAGGSDDDTDETADGTLYRLRTGAKGAPEFRSRILID